MADPRLSGDVKMAAAVAGSLTLVAALIGEEVVSWVVAPVIIAAIVYMLVKAPLRNSISALIFLALTLENPSEFPAAGSYQSPLFKVGGLLLTHINTIVKLPIP